MKFTLTVNINDALVNKLSFALRCSKADAKQLIKSAVVYSCNAIQMQELCIWDKDSRHIDFNEPSSVTGCEIIKGSAVSIHLHEKSN